MIQKLKTMICGLLLPLFLMGVTWVLFKQSDAYNQFDLPKSWGTGETGSVDGTYWNVYTNNLLAEHHIRYGQYGGIGYYHVSDQYIALFSNFIPCGVYEATYIFDGIIESEEFNNFIDWVSFGREGTIEDNLRVNQKKTINFGRLVANAVMLHVIANMTNAINELTEEGNALITGAGLLVITVK